MRYLLSLFSFCLVFYLIVTTFARNDGKTRQALFASPFPPLFVYSILLRTTLFSVRIQSATKRIKFWLLCRQKEKSLYHPASSTLLRSHYFECSLKVRRLPPVWIIRTLAAVPSQESKTKCASSVSAMDFIESACSWFFHGDLLLNLSFDNLTEWSFRPIKNTRVEIGVMHTRPCFQIRGDTVGRSNYQYATTKRRPATRERRWSNTWCRTILFPTFPNSPLSNTINRSRWGNRHRLTTQPHDKLGEDAFTTFANF